MCVCRRSKKVSKKYQSLFGGQCWYCDGGYKQINIWTLESVKRLLNCNGSEDICWVGDPSYGPKIISKYGLRDRISGHIKMHLAHTHTMRWFVNSVFTMLDRKPSSAESPLIQTTVTLPHVILESVPLYIHAGQYIPSSRSNTPTVHKCNTFEKMCAHNTLC